MSEPRGVWALGPDGKLYPVRLELCGVFGPVAPAAAVHVAGQTEEAVAKLKALGYSNVRPLPDGPTEDADARGPTA